MEAGHLTALIGLCAVMFFYGLGWLPLIGPDEPRYAEVAREMYLTGDWITPRLAGINWFEKPALAYWLSAAGYRIFGVSEFGARFGIAVLATLCVLMLYLFGVRLGSTRFGFLSAMALATCGLWPGFARGATFDLPLSVALALALLSFFLWERDEAGRWRNLHWAIFNFGLGAAVLAKGLVGVVLPLAMIGLYLVLTGRLKAVLQPKLLMVGGLIFLATASIWYGPMIAWHGRDFVSQFFIEHHFQRYLSNKYRHPQPFYFFFLVALAGSFPWIFYLASSARNSVRRYWTKRDWADDRLNLFLWLWVLTPVVFFSFSGSKLPGYILPVFPAVALLVGGELERWWTEGESRDKHLLVAGTSLVIFVVAVFFGLRGGRELGLDLFSSFTVATMGIIVSIVHLGLWLVLSGRAATVFLPFGVGLVIMTASHQVFPALAQRESLRDLALQAGRQARPNERLVFYVNQDHGVNFYATALPLRDERAELVTVARPEAIRSLIEKGGSQSILVLSRREWSDGVAILESLSAVKLGEQKGSLKCSPKCDWVLLRVTSGESESIR